MKWFSRKTGLPEPDAGVRMDWSCARCYGEGEIRAPGPNPADPFLVVCGHCNTESAYLWCEQCGLGGQIGRFDRGTLRWTCDSCRQTGSLPVNFCDDPVMFFPAAFATPRPARVRYGELPEGPLRNMYLRWDKSIRNIKFISIIFAPFFVIILIYLFVKIFSFSEDVISIISPFLFIPVWVFFLIQIVLGLVRFPFWIVARFRDRDTRGRTTAAAAIFLLMVAALLVLLATNYWSDWVLVCFLVAAVAVLFLLSNQIMRR